jgi:hypothetical protein
MLVFLDDASRRKHEYILKYKSEALKEFQERQALGYIESGKQVKRFCTDGAGEYTSKKLAEYIISEVILKEMTMPYTSQSNGVVEPANHMNMQRV